MPPFNCAIGELRDLLGSSNRGMHGLRLFCTSKLLPTSSLSLFPAHAEVQLGPSRHHDHCKSVAVVMSAEMPFCCCIESRKPNCANWSVLYYCQQDAGSSITTWPASVLVVTTQRMSDGRANSLEPPSGLPCSSRYRVYHC